MSDETPTPTDPTGGPTPPPTRGRTRKKDQGVPDLQIPKSGFNFYGPQWAAKQRIRSTNLFTALGFTVVAAGLLTGWLLLTTHNADLDQQVADQGLRRNVALLEVVEITGGIDNLPDHVSKRRIMIEETMAIDVDTQTIVDAVLDTVPPGVSITHIDLDVEMVPATPAADSSEPDSGDPADESDTDEADTEPVSPDDSDAPPTAAARPKPTIRIHATEVPGSAALWRTTLENSAYFENVVVVLDNTLTVTLTVSDDLLSRTRSRTPQLLDTTTPQPGQPASPTPDRPNRPTPPTGADTEN